MPNDTAAADAVADTEITLARGDLRLKVSPFGASLRGLWREGPGGAREEIVTGYTGAKGKVGGQGDVLIPFSGRVAGGRYTFGGQTYAMPINDKDGPNAIHGFLRQMPWEVTAQAAELVTFAVSLTPEHSPGYPFPLHATVAYALDAAGGMTCRFSIQNTGDRPAPVAAGFHPYFTVGSEQIDEDVLHVPMAATLEFQNLIPTGRILPVDNTPLDFRFPHPIGTTVFNTCFLAPARDPDGKLRIRLGASLGGRHLTVWMDGTFDYVVLYSGEQLPDSHRRRSLAIEPMTCGSDAFNHPQWGLKSLAPGETFSGAWGVAHT